MDAGTQCGPDDEPVSGRDGAPSGWAVADATRSNCKIFVYLNHVGMVHLC